MTDLEMTLLCAKASDGLLYCPLVNDAQAMLLIKKLHLHIDQRPGKQVSVQSPDFDHLVVNKDMDLNRAIVECVARIQNSVIKSSTTENKP